MWRTNIPDVPPDNTYLGPDGGEKCCCSPGPVINCLYKVGRLLNVADKMRKMTTILAKLNIFIFQKATLQTISLDAHTSSFIL